METYISSKYGNLKYKREIFPGSPSVYRLIPEQKNIGSIRRLTLGERDPTKMNKTILLVGETGTGKSTLTNALVNFALGVKFEDDVWFKMVQEKEKIQTESQTSDVIVYEVFGLEDRTLPFSLTIIDTPGYGDTRGKDKDALVSERLSDLFRSTDGVHDIDAVCLVLKASDNRLSDRLMYVFDSVMSLFGKDIEKNIVALVTHSDFMTPENVLRALKDESICLAKDEQDRPVHFMFNNTQKTERKKERGGNERALKYAWESTEDQISQFTDFLKDTKPKNLKGTVEVLNSRMRLKASIKNLEEKVQSIEKKQREIQQTREVLKKLEQDMKNNKNFEIEVDETFKIKVPVEDKKIWWMFRLNKSGAVCCEVCEENCHYPCEEASGPNQCDVIVKQYCTVCTGRCHESKHVKADWRYVSKTRKVKNPDNKIKEMYEQGKQGNVESVSLLETLQKKMKKLQKDKDQFLEESFRHVVKLEEIALKGVSLSTQVHLDFLIKKMKEKGDTEKAMKLEKMKSQMEENPRVKSALSYMSGK